MYTLIGADWPPTGTVAVIWVGELTVNDGEATVPNVTLVMLTKLLPVMTTVAPAAPEVGEKLLTVGVTLNVFGALETLPLGVSTMIDRVVAVEGTVASMRLSDFTVKLAVRSEQVVGRSGEAASEMATVEPTGPCIGAKLVMVGPVA